MDPEAIMHTAEFLSTGGVSTVIALLIIVIIILLWERNRILKKIEETNKQLYQSKKDEIESIKGIIDLYHQGNINLIQTLAEIKGVLANIQMYRSR